MAINTSPHSGTINPPPIRDCKTFSSCMCVLSCFPLFCYTQIYSFHSKSNPFCSRSQGQTQVEAQGGPSPLGSKKKKKKKFSYNIFHFCSQVSFLHNKPNQSHSNSNYLAKKLNKNNKNIHNGDCILAQKKKNYFTTKKPKNNVLLEKLKLKFLQLQ